MVVCHCNGITDRTIRRAVREGAATRALIAQACAAGGCCGGCGPEIDAILDDERGPAPLVLGELAVAAASANG